MSTPVKKNTALSFTVMLTPQSGGGNFSTSPTLAAGDVKISIDQAASANLATLPTAAADGRVTVSLSAAEMNGDEIVILFKDAAGAEWNDLTINIRTTAVTLDEIPGNVWEETRAGHTTAGTMGEGITVEAFTTNGAAAVEAEALDALESVNLDHLMGVAVASNADLTAEVVDGSVMSNLLTTAGDTSTYSNTTDSLQSLRDNQQPAAQAALEANNLDHLIGAAVDTDFGTTVHANSVIGYIADISATTSFDRSTDSLEALQAAIPTYSAADVADAVWDEALGGHTTAGTAGAVANDLEDGGRLDLIVDAILADSAELQGDLTDGGRLDLIFDAINSTTSNISNVTRNKTVGNSELILPSSGTQGYLLDLYIYDTDGNMEAPDATPSISGLTGGGGALPGTLGAVSAVATGHYRATYTVNSSDAEEQLVFQWTYVEGGNSIISPFITRATAASSTPPTAASIADAVWDETRAGHTTAGTFGEGVNVEALTTNGQAAVEAEAVDALESFNLDHLAAVAVASNADMTAEVVDGSILSNIMSSSSDTSTYTVATDSLEANKDALLTTAQVNTEVDTALTDINLDHLLSAATAAADMTTEVVDGSVISRILSGTSDTSTYDPTTDALDVIAANTSSQSGGAATISIG